MDRLLLTLVLVAVCVLAGFGLWWGWRSRARRQVESLALPELPAVPGELGEPLAEPLAGVYVATTTAGHWQDRVVDRGLGRRAAATVALHGAGVLIDRVGEEPIFVPAAGLTAVGTAPGIAGKVMGMAQGVLVITWSHGGVALDTGIRANDLAAQADWILAARHLISVRTAPGADRNDTE